MYSLKKKALTLLFFMPCMHVSMHAALLLQYALPIEVAEKMVQAAVEKAKSENIQLTFSVVDDHGALRYQYVMDGARSVSVDVAQMKATAAARTRMSTRVLMERNTEKVGFGYGNFPNVVLLPGGVPIVAENGATLGAIGVSGASGDQDEACALHGLAEVKPLLK